MLNDRHGEADSGHIRRSQFIALRRGSAAVTWEAELNFASPGLEPRASQPAAGTGKDYPASSKNSFRPYFPNISYIYIYIYIYIHIHIPVDGASVQIVQTYLLSGSVWPSDAFRFVPVS